MTNSPATTAETGKPAQLNVAIDAALKQQLKLHAVKHQLPLHKFAERLLQQGISQMNGADGQNVVPSAAQSTVDSEA